MACPAIITGDAFLSRTLEHIDCQAQLIGSYGYQALGEPGSLASTLMTGLLTLFIALFALRVMFGPAPAARDIVGDVLKIGIVMTLAFSWPAFRTLIYDVTLDGPAEIASMIETASQGERSQSLAQRLQQVDNQITALIELGTGRNTGQLIDADAPGGTFAASALQDESTLGTARLAFLASVIGILAVLRIAAGFLLALTPLAAGLLLFTQSRGIFAGWLKGLVFALIGSMGASIVLVVELALLEPWLADALRVRQLGYATPSAPTELLALTLAFALAQLVMLALLARVAFYRGWLDLSALPGLRSERGEWSAPGHLARPATIEGPGRAERISGQVGAVVRREERYHERLSYRTLQGSPSTMPQTNAGPLPYEPPRLGSSYRRTQLRHSRAGSRRDAQS